MTGLSGGCLCRSVRFSVTGPIIRTGHCHCESCRRATSSPVTSFFCVARADASFEGEALRHYASSPGVRRGFCGNCGSPMSYETAERPAEIDLYVASLDDATSVSVTQHWYWKERVAWFSCDDDLPKHEN
ncbi:GFA family protein [Mycoplana rhizolycopersici]|uniref:GFA family protein n=1 Tax=Mycoplana rhizolycopersici TaxID=2746702 RepID=A0ABX2QH68_9HYPH|nr:GFA family protein [Rhizobium rhizolycopersici]NVP57130.1 GFA family protein [Rhizobium rhizolycopersici]